MEPNGVPDFLRAHARWCTWTPIERNGRTTKKPSISTRDLKACKTWSQVEGQERLGFVLTGGVSTAAGFLVCLDLDACVDPATGEVSAWALAIYEHYGSHTRTSPSGTGLHIWLIVRSLPRLNEILSSKLVPFAAAPGSKGKRPGIQLFGLGPALFVTVGPNVVHPAEAAVVENLDWLLDSYSMRASSLPGKQELPTGDPMDPAELIEQVRWRNHGPELIDGHWKAVVADGKSASDAYYMLQILCLETCDDGPSVVDALLEHTAWGRGEIEDSRDPARYARREWVERDLARVAGKTGAAERVSNEFPVLDEALPEGTATNRSASSAVPAEARTDPLRPDADASASPAAAAGRGRWFATAPPEQLWLLRHPDGTGMLPRGKAALFTAAGGSGKTNAIVQLAIAVATGGRWFRHFLVDELAPRRVLLLLGEEDADEVHRRLWNAGKHLSREQQDMVEENVTALGLHGQLCSILKLDGKTGAVAKTKHLRAIHDRLAAGPEHGLVVLDPLSRFAGFAEKDNDHGTLLVQHLEQLCRHPGHPVVKMVGHSSKFARRNGTADSRGVTGIPDGVRWHATLTGDGLKRAVFGWEKNNYGRPAEPVRLVRGEFGLLHAEGAEDAAEAATAAERAEFERQQGDLLRITKLVPVVIDYVRAHPGCFKSSVMDCAGGRRQLLGRAVEMALAEGKLTKVKTGLHVSELFL